MKTDINYSINMRGYDHTQHHGNGGYPVLRKSSYTMGGYKMIAKKAIKRVLIIES